jgi:hypothetical protein
MQDLESKARLPVERVPEIIFVHWAEALSRAGLAYPKRSGYEAAITAYLEYCRHNGVSVTVESARGFIRQKLLIKSFLACL